MCEVDLKIVDADVLLNPNPEEIRREKTDIFIDQGKIVAIGHGQALTAKKHLNLKGLTVLPGLIDSQVHFREPGYEHKEDLETGSRAALLGGITTVFEMPNTKPPTTSVDLLEDKICRSSGRMFVHFAFFAGGSTKNTHHVPEMEQKTYVPGVKIFMGSSFGDLLVSEVEELEPFFRICQKPIVVHAEDQNKMNYAKSIIQPTHVSEHPKWRSSEACFAATELAVKLALKYQKKLHVLHVSSRQEIELLKNLKPLITFEILPQHLTFHAPDCYLQYGTLVQQNPPIREIEHQKVLWRAVTEGWVTTLGSDHAPHILEEKMRPYPESPSGMPGVQTLVPIMLTHVHHQRLSLERLVELMTIGVRRVYSIKNKGLLHPGYDADLTVVDLKKEWIISKSWLQSKCGWSPFENWKVIGFPAMTILNGEVCQEDGHIIGPPKGQAVVFNCYPQIDTDKSSE